MRDKMDKKNLMTDKINCATKKRVLLIGAGEIGKEKIQTQEEDYVIALDGGLLYCAKHDIMPDMIVGDFDSLPADKQVLLQKYPKQMIKRLPCEKDDTDTMAAIKLAIEQGFNRFIIYGGLGGRLSHTVANIQTLMYLKERGMQGELVGDGSKLFLIQNETCKLQPEECAYVSVLAYSENAKGVTIKNLKYEVCDITLINRLPLGVSNEFVGKTAEITVKQGTLLVIIETKGKEVSC